MYLDQETSNASTASSNTRRRSNRASVMEEVEKALASAGMGKAPSVAGSCGLLKFWVLKLVIEENCKSYFISLCLFQACRLVHPFMFVPAPAKKVSMPP